MTSILSIAIALVVFIIIAGLVVFLSVKSKVAKIIFMIVLVPAAAAIAYLCVESIKQPLNFQKETEARKAVAVQRLKDIRTLEVGFKSVYGHYTASVDSLKQFYNEGQMEIVMQIGSQDDSVAVARTAALKKKNPKITNEQLYALHLEGENVIVSITQKIPVKDTLCNRADFCVDSLAFIPCCGDSVRMEALVKTVSGVKVPLFEAKMPYGEKEIVQGKTKSVDKNGNAIEIAEKYVINEYLLKGLDHQLIVNLCTELIDTDRYPGLMVGSVSAPNNNAGNWE